MRRNHRRFLAPIVVTGVALGLLGAAGTATAACALKLQGSGAPFDVTDNSGLDSSAQIGVVTYIGSVDAMSVVVTCIGKPVFDDTAEAQLDVSGVVTGPGTLTVYASDNNYFAGSSGGDSTLITTVGGTTNGSATFQTFANTANVPFATGCTAGPMGPYTTASYDGTSSAACTLTGPVALTFKHVRTASNDSFGGSMRIGRPAEKIGCRFTGGGVDTDYNWDHTLESGEMIKNGAGNLPDPIDRYQFGGQAGARTGQQPTPSGEWQHHQQTGPSGAFAFHGGTSSAAPGTWIADIRCSDPGFCFPARPAPAKQLDFDGVGTFSNVGKGKNAPVFQIGSPNVIPEPNGGKTAPFTFHWFEVNIDDLGEPGRKNDGAPNSQQCPGRGFGEKSAGNFYPDPVNLPDVVVPLPAAPLADCDCPDFYRITIYKGVLSTEVSYLPNGKVDPASMNRSDVIYEVFGYIDGGNLQIHPPTGYDTH